MTLASRTVPHWSIVAIDPKSDGSDAESRDQFHFITDLTVRGKGALRVMGIRFAQAPYSATESG
jgi:hypothetical protein